MTIRPAHVALLYTLYISLAVLLIAPMMPPFQNADEGAHALRADQISHLHFLAEHLPGGGTGGLADPGVGDQNSLLTSLPSHRERKVNRYMYAPAGWGTPALIAFSNTAIYPPFFYFPAAFMISLGRSLSLPVLHTLILSRIVTGFTTAALGAMAITLGGNAAIWFFAILLLPMSMSLSAGITQDGPMFASTALAVSLCLYLRQREPLYGRPAFALMCILLALVGMARPPYLAFCLIVFSTKLPRIQQILCVCMVAICVCVWSTYNASFVSLPHLPNGAVNPSVQLSGLIHHPAHWAQLVASSWSKWRSDWLLGFVGVLGWLDVDLPRTYHLLARASLVLALILTLLSGTGAVRLADIVLTLIAVFLVFNAVLLIQYLTWTVVGAPVVEGVQGRYALAPALLLGAAIGTPPIAAIRISSPLTMAAFVVVMGMPLLSISIVIHALMLRYYL